MALAQDCLCQVSIYGKWHFLEGCRKHLIMHMPLVVQHCSKAHPRGVASTTHCPPDHLLPARPLRDGIGSRLPIGICKCICRCRMTHKVLTREGMHRPPTGPQAAERWYWEQAAHWHPLRLPVP